MRTKESFEYGEEHEEIIYKFVNHIPRTTNSIAALVKEKYFAKIHPHTVQRLLENLQKVGRIKKFQTGRVSLWQL